MSQFWNESESYEEDFGEEEEAKERTKTKVGKEGREEAPGRRNERRELEHVDRDKKGEPVKEDQK
jgi:hypothetical protein